MSLRPIANRNRHSREVRMAMLKKRVMWTSGVIIFLTALWWFKAH